MQKPNPYQEGDKQVYYKTGYKYQTTRYRNFRIPLYPKKNIETEWIKLTTTGWLYIKKGYAWDGASGPTFDTPDSIRGSLIHDALYQLIRLGLLDKSYRCIADDILREICQQDGMPELRAKMWHDALNFFGWASADSNSEPKEKVAP